MGVGTVGFGIIGQLEWLFAVFRDPDLSVVAIIFPVGLANCENNVFTIWGYDRSPCSFDG